MAEPKRRGPGRPAVGPMTALRLPADLRERLDAARRPGESMAEAARRLLTTALDALPSCRFCGRLLTDDGECPAACDDYPPERAAGGVS